MTPKQHAVKSLLYGAAIAIIVSMFAVALGVTSMALIILGSGAGFVIGAPMMAVILYRSEKTE